MLAKEMPESSHRLRGVAYLVMLGLVAAVVLANVEKLTAQRILENELAERYAALVEVLPAGAYDNQPHLNRIYVNDPELLGTQNPLPIYRASKGERPVAAVMTAVAPNGYSGEIRLLIGIDASGQVTGVRVTSHRETPGLGDAIDVKRSDWIESFAGLDGAELETNPLARAWILERDGGTFDHITSATVTSRAVVNAVRNAVIYFELNRDWILNTPAAPLDEPPAVTSRVSPNQRIEN